MQYFKPYFYERLNATNHIEIPRHLFPSWLKNKDIATLIKWKQMFFNGNKIPTHILVNRVDAMGDVILALPVCGLIKKHFPECKVSFLGRTYTKSVALSSIHVDAFINADDWAHMTHDQIRILLRENKVDTVIHLLPDKPTIIACKKAGIRIRVGAINRIIYWLNCNRLVFVSRKKSRLSEAQLNIKLLGALNIKERPDRNELYKYYGFTRLPKLEESNKKLLDPHKINLIIHPLSNKNAKEWGLHNFSALVNLIDKERFKIFITGSGKEKKALTSWLVQHKNEATDLTGTLDLDQLIAFIAAADGLIASSTGPVHVAAAAGINTLGLYENRWAKRAERWGPIGKKADFLECAREDMDSITADMVYEKISKWKPAAQLT